MFGEYLPLGETFPILYKWSPNSGQFTAGTTLDPLRIIQGGAEHRVTTLICYEDIIPAFTRAAVNHADPEMLVNMTNDAWFGDSTEPWEHLALAKFRAIEHRKYLIRSTNSGVSAIIDPVGRVVAQTSTMTQETLLETVHWLAGGRTLYGLIGDGLWWLVALSATVGAFVRRRASFDRTP
jgi:apolipoprotein N-acyltransferase